MVLTVNKLYKVAKALENDEEVLKLYEDFKNSSIDEEIKLTEVIVTVINNGGLDESEEVTSLFENDSLTISTYNGRLYYVTVSFNENGKGKKLNANITDEILAQHKLTKRGEEFIKKYLPPVVKSENPKKKPKGKKKSNKKNDQKVTENKTNE